MILAITAAEDNLSSPVDMRFGRAKGFILYNTDTLVHTFKENTINNNAIQGAGIQTSKAVIDYNASVLITGNVGPKAFSVLKQSDVSIMLVKEITIQEAIDLYYSGKLKAIENPNVEGHW